MPWSDAYIAGGTVPAADAGRRLRQAASGPVFVGPGRRGRGSVDGERRCLVWSRAAAWSQAVRDHEPGSASGNAAVHDDNAAPDLREADVADCMGADGKGGDRLAAAAGAAAGGRKAGWNSHRSRKDRSQNAGYSWFGPFASARLTIWVEGVCFRGTIVP